MIKKKEKNFFTAQKLEHFFFSNKTYSNLLPAERRIRLTFS
jgi:hypothetical protein